MSVLHRRDRLSWWNWAFYACVVLAIMAPMLRSGYILTLDMVFTPKIAGPSAVSNSYLFQELLHLLNLVLPSQVIEKLIIFVIMLSSGLGMHAIVESIKFKVKSWSINADSSKLSTFNLQLSAYFAGLFYIVNPWTYERWMAGHYLLLAGYAVLPFFYRALLGLLDKPNRRDLIFCGLTYVLIGILSLHMVVLAGILGIVTAIVYGTSKPRTELMTLAKYLAGLIIGVLALSNYWFIELVLGHSAVAKQIASFNLQDLQAFTTAGQPHYGLLVNVLGGYGFWLERYGRYIRPNYVIVSFLVGLVAIGALVVIGVKRQVKLNLRLALSFGITALVAFVFTVGIHARLTGPSVEWILLHMPVMRGFREPEKFSALLVFAYAIFGGLGVEWLQQRLKNPASLVLVLLLPLVYVPTMLWGFHNQLKPVHYPASWQAFNTYLSQNPTSAKVLFLPWHEYMSYDFTSRVIASPAPGFFKAQIIAGDNAEFGKVIRDGPASPTSAAVEAALRTNQDGGFATKLAPLNVRYVLLSRGYDASDYTFLNTTPGLKLISKKPGLTVWENQLVAK